MLKIAVCDDDSLIREIVRAAVERTVNAKTDFYESGEDLLSSETAYDIVFLDICFGEKGIRKSKMAWRLRESTGAVQMA